MLWPNAYTSESTANGRSASPLHQLHPLYKLAMLLCLTIMTFAIRQPLHALVVFAVLLAGYALAGTSPLLLTRKLRNILLFGLMIIGVQLIFYREGVLWLTLNLGPVHFPIYIDALSAGVIMAFRFVNVITASHLFVRTTDPNRLAHALMAIGLPYMHGFMLVTALRFVPVFHYELQQVRNAQQAKGIRLDRSWRGLTQGIRYLLLPLVVSALSKVDSLTISMEGRAFGLHPQRTFRSTARLRSGERTGIVVAVLATAFYLIALR